MKHFWNWTFQFVVNLFSVGLGVVSSLYLLDLRDDYVGTSNEDPIWEILWCIILTAGVAALISCIFNSIRNKSN